MSQAEQSISYVQAEGIIARLALMLKSSETCSTFMVCGSFRRGRTTINDIDVVAIPHYVAGVDPTAPSMFGDAEPVLFNQLNMRLDEMLAAGEITQARYGDTQVTRWGNKLRGFMFDGIKVEIDQTDERGFGVKCLIRTGCAEFSQSIVTHIKRRGIHRVYGGYLRPAHGDDLKQKEKDALPIIPCPSEKDVFDAAGKLWIPPSLREEALQ